MPLWKSTQEPGFYLVADDVELPAGQLVLEDRGRRTLSVDPDAVEAHRVSDTEARIITIAEVALGEDGVPEGIEAFRDVARGLGRHLHGAHGSPGGTSHPGGGPLRPPESLDASLDALLPDPGDASGRLALGTRIAERVRQHGGPDWRGEPEAAFLRVRDALRDPTTDTSLQGLWHQSREEPPVPSPHDARDRTDD